MKFNHKGFIPFFLVYILIAALSLGGCGHTSDSDTEEKPAAESTQEMETESETETETEAEIVTVDWNGPSFDWSHLYYYGGLRAYEDDQYTSKVVIDFSKSQKVTDWGQLQDCGVDAVILKLGSRGYTEGSLIEDSSFVSNYQGAVENGMEVYGVYFYSQALNEEEAMEEADFVLEKLADAGVSKNVMVFYDLETGYDGNNGVYYRNYQLTNKQLKKNLKTFAQELETNGYTAGVYTNLKWHGRSLKRSMFKGYPLWFACYKDEPTIKKSLTLWQYSDQGLLDGISGHVDLNVLFVPKYDTDGEVAENTSAEQESTMELTSTEAETASDIVTKERVKWNEDWEYASYSKIHSDKATLYHSIAEDRKNIVVAVNAGHGTSGGESVKTQCHPDGSPKVTGGSTSVGSLSAAAVSSGTTLLDGTEEAVVTLKVAKLVKKKLLAAGYDVLMLRKDSDCQLDNIARTVMANNNADCHISIHYDSSDTDKGFFYISVPDVDSYRSMEPVASHWQEHNALGEAILSGMEEVDANIWSSETMAIDLTQTSYSTIPSVDLEVGDRASSTDQDTLNRIAKGIVKGIENYFE